MYDYLQDGSCDPPGSHSKQLIVAEVLELHCRCTALSLKQLLYFAILWSTCSLFGRESLRCSLRHVSLQILASWSHRHASFPHVGCLRQGVCSSEWPNYCFSPTRHTFVLAGIMRVRMSLTWRSGGQRSSSSASLQQAAPNSRSGGQNYSGYFPADSLLPSSATSFVSHLSLPFSHHNLSPIFFVYFQLTSAVKCVWK